MQKISVNELSKGKIQQLLPLLSVSCFSPIRYYPQYLHIDPCSYWLKLIENDLLVCGSKLLVCTIGSDTVGFAVLAPQSWESRVLQTNVSSIKHFVVNESTTNKSIVARRLLDGVIDISKSNKTKFLSCKIFADNNLLINSLCDARFILADTCLIYGFNFDKTRIESLDCPERSDNLFVRHAITTDLDKLIELANKSFESHFGRFHSDPNIPKRQAVKIYEEWMRSSLDGYGDFVLIAELGGKIVGFLVLKKPSYLEESFSLVTGHFSIGGVHPDCSKQGIFSYLLYKGMLQLQDISTYIDTTTHVNKYGAQRALSNLKWRIYDAKHTFHRWFL